MPIETPPFPPAKSAKPWPVMVLAHNEEAHIVACLNSLRVEAPEQSLEVYVMANGCTDKTEALTREYATLHPSVQVVSIRLADKCNAWNVFVHEVATHRCPDSAVYFFADGDARAVPGSLRAMAAALERDDYANAASAPPASGRNAAHDRRELLEQRGLVANLYALRGGFVRRLIEQRVRLPLKHEGDDGLLGALIKWDLDPQHRQFDHRRIVACADAGFEFDSVSPFSAAGLRGYWRRAVRYGRRSYEFELLGKRLKRAGIAGLPADITELYAGARDLDLRWNGVYTLSNWVALRQMRRHAGV